MKKLFMLVLLTISMVMFAQTNKENAKAATSKGNFMLGLNTTNLGFTNTEKSGTSINAGIQAGYFVDSKTALLVGGGYNTYLSKSNDYNRWTYMVGVKQYIGSVVPVQVDWNGATGNSINPAHSNIGVQAGYGWFVAKNFSIEPAVRYNISLNSSENNVLSGAFGFNYIF